LSYHDTQQQKVENITVLYKNSQLAMLATLIASLLMNFNLNAALKVWRIFLKDLTQTLCLTTF